MRARVTNECDTLSWACPSDWMVVGWWWEIPARLEWCLPRPMAAQQKAGRSCDGVVTFRDDLRTKLTLGEPFFLQERKQVNVGHVMPHPERLQRTAGKRPHCQILGPDCALMLKLQPKFDLRRDVEVDIRRKEAAVCRVKGEAFTCCRSDGWWNVRFCFGCHCAIARVDLLFKELKRSFLTGWRLESVRLH